MSAGIQTSGGCHLPNSHMRLVKINCPVGFKEKIIETAFSAGIDNISSYPTTQFTPGGAPEERDVVDIETSTPKAKRFIDTFLAADYYDQKRMTFNIRQPRSLITRDDIGEKTYPICEPSTDLFEELWQFSHVTYGLVGRICVSAGLLAYGMIESKLLLMIGGLLFLPVLPMVMAIGYGIVGRQWRLSVQGLIALATGLAILFLGGIVVAAVSTPPLRFNELGSPGVGIIISLAVGIAAQLAAIDDAGRREMIGLAAASQIGLSPVWLGIILVFGLPADTARHEVFTHVLSIAANLIVLLLAIVATQYFAGVVGNIRRVQC